MSLDCLHYQKDKRERETRVYPVLESVKVSQSEKKSQAKRELGG